MKLTPKDEAIIALLRVAERDLTALQIAEICRLNAGLISSRLIKMEKAKMITSRWLDSEGPNPRKRVYSAMTTTDNNQP